VRSGSAQLKLNVQSLTSLFVLCMALRREVEPSVPPRLQALFTSLVQHLFENQTSQKTFQQLEISAMRAAEAKGYCFSEGLRERLVMLHCAVMERGDSTTVVTGPAASGKSSLVSLLAESEEALCGDRVQLERIALDPRLADDVCARLTALFAAPTNEGGSMVWIVLEGVVSDAVLAVINTAPRSSQCRLIYETAEQDFPKLNKMVLVNLYAEVSDQAWTPQVKRFLDRFSKKLHDSDRYDQLLALFDDNFMDVLSVCEAAQTHCRLVISTIAYLEGLLRMLPSNPDSAVVERAFWFAATYGCAPRPCEAWNTFVHSRMTSTAVPKSGIYNVGLSQTGEWQLWQSLTFALKNPCLLPSVSVTRALFLARLILGGEGSIALVGPAGSAKSLTGLELAKERLMAATAVTPPSQSGYLIDSFHLAPRPLQEFLAGMLTVGHVDASRLHERPAFRGRSAAHFAPAHHQRDYLCIHRARWSGLADGQNSHWRERCSCPRHAVRSSRITRSNAP
jgi:hypothetical protein